MQIAQTCLGRNTRREIVTGHDLCTICINIIHIIPNNTSNCLVFCIFRHRICCGCIYKPFAWLILTIQEHCLGINICVNTIGMNICVIECQATTDCPFIVNQRICPQRNPTCISVERICELRLVKQSLNPETIFLASFITTGTANGNTARHTARC